MNVQKYLDRIQYYGEMKTSKEVLYSLQKQHLLNIPFENLDIHYNTNIKLDLKKIYKKIVLKSRGGFCYELNGLFNQLLVQLGFKSTLISGRVHIKNEDYGQEFDHMAMIVNLEEKNYLVDVGFGKFILEPIEIILNKPQIDSYGVFIFDKFNSNYYSVNQFEKGQLIPQYIFKTEERKLDDFEVMCNYHQTSDKSHFTKKKVISIARLNGRLTLNNTQLKITNGSEIDEVNFKEDEFEEYLSKYFGIKI